MADSSDIDGAILAALNGDATLTALMPGKAGFDLGPVNAKQFVVVSLILAPDSYGFDPGRAFEGPLYLIKAVELAGLAPSNIKAAAARIETLLTGAALTIPGYALLVIRRAERVRFTEVDGVDPSIRWYHRGGRYEVLVAPAAA